MFLPGKKTDYGEIQSIYFLNDKLLDNNKRDMIDETRVQFKKNKDNKYPFSLFIKQSITTDPFGKEIKSSEHLIKYPDYAMSFYNGVNYGK